MSDYYVERVGGFLELRQTRFENVRQSRSGQGHRHDVCAVARDREEMQKMLDVLKWEADWRAE